METILVTKSSMPDFEEYIEEIRELWESHWLTNKGEKHTVFQNLLTNYFNRNVSLVVNGHCALEVAIQSLQLKGEVITTPFTFVSTTHAIVRNGLKPVFCDIDPITYTLDVTKMEELINENTSAIIPVHVYGNVCNIEEIEAIAKKYNLKVIYDAAHAFGVKYKGKSIAEYGDASMFSFHATKVFNTIEGGAVCYSDSEIGNQIERLINFGIQDEVLIDGIGTNAKMNEFQAAMGICNLRHVEEEIRKRGLLVEEYRELLSGIDGIQLNIVQEDVTSNYAYFPIIIHEEMFGATRDDVYEWLKSKNIFARRYFFPIISKLECYKGMYEKYETPVAVKISERVLTLPLYADLDINIVKYICNIILKRDRA